MADICEQSCVCRLRLAFSGRPPATHCALQLEIISRPAKPKFKQVLKIPARLKVDGAFYSVDCVCVCCSGPVELNELGKRERIKLVSIGSLSNRLTPDQIRKDADHIRQIKRTCSRKGDLLLAKRKVRVWRCWTVSNWSPRFLYSAKGSTPKCSL